MAEEKQHSEETIAKFKELFWKSRKDLLAAGKNASGEIDSYRMAIKFCEENLIPTELVEASFVTSIIDKERAGFLLGHNSERVPRELLPYWDFVRGSLLSGLGRDEEALESYDKALATEGYDTPGMAWSNKGIVLSGLGRDEEALESYDKALATEGFDTPGMAWNNRGTVLSGLGRDEEALESYDKALATEGFDTPGMAWNNRGTVLSGLGRDEEALESYDKALATEGYDTPGMAWNNKGIVLSGLGRDEEALESYDKALATEGYDTPGMAWNNKGICYRELDDFSSAIDAHKKALEITDSDDPQYARAKQLLEIAESGLEKSALNEKDRLITENSPDFKGATLTEKRIHRKIIESGDTQYDKYAEKSNSTRNDQQLSILRGWCSSVTLLEGSDGRWLGGGYFLVWKGKGLVIDPGFDFLRNFHDVGFHGRNIDAVFVSHNHPDHNQDLKPVDDLRYELYRRLNNAPENPLPPYALLWDQDTAGEIKFGMEKPKHHHEPILCSTGYCPTFDLSTDPWNLPFRITPFKVEHTSDVPHALGAVIELLSDDNEVEVKIGYTADTGYFEGLSDHLKDCDILIAHFSQPTLEEVTDSSKSHAGHLGYRGTIRLLRETKPKLALIGEFWAGFTDLRIDLTNALREQVGVDTILPTGIGMKLDIPSLQVICDDCGKKIAPEKIRIVPPPVREPFGNLSYFCNECMVG